MSDHPPGGTSTKDRNACLVVIAVLGVLVALGYLVYSQMKAVADTGSVISEELITRYVGLIKDGRYEQAYETCLAKAYQDEIPIAEFVAAHTSHREKFGELEDWRESSYVDEADLSGGESLIGIKGTLHYTGRDVFVLYKVNPAVEPYRIRRAFGSAAASTSLSEGIW